MKGGTLDPHNVGNRLTPMDTCTTSRQPGSGRRQSARTVEKVDTVNDLVLGYKSALKCIKPRVKLRGRPALITRHTAFLSGFSMKMSEEMACAGTHYTATVH